MAELPRLPRLNSPPLKALLLTSFCQSGRKPHIVNQYHEKTAFSKEIGGKISRFSVNVKHSNTKQLRQLFEVGDALMTQNRNTASPGALHFPEMDLRHQYVTGYYLAFGKRLFDVVVASLLLVTLLPILCLIAVLASLGGGSPFYAHERIGQNGRRFNCLKFRTMRLDSDAVLKQLLISDSEAAKEWHETRKLENDPRITFVGRLLRRTSLDELPQLINVIRADMSLVGPRPVTEEELERYSGHLSKYLSLRPGLTGIWQVHGRGRVDYNERVEMDAQYFRTVSLSSDLTLLFLTSFVILKRQGQ